MRQKRLGSTNEEVPEIGIGTWKIGSRANEEKAAIRKGIDLGMDLVDTAEMYANEDIVGDAIKGKKVFVATKVSPHNFRHDDVIAACERSLSRLGVKSIDLYQLHWPNNKVPIKETMSAMEELVDSGRIKHIGVSNFSVDEIKDAQASMRSHQIVSNQVEYSILVREIEEELLHYCEKSRITVIAYSPLARGAIFQRGTELYGALEQIAAAHKKSIAQVALNWIISRKGVIAIPKASDAAHMRENAGASGWELSKKEIGEISKAAIEKRSLSASFKPVISNHSGLVSGAYSAITGLKRLGRQRKSSTTKSSKK
jgi:diketogulonate reductase-like aldo/keto reductase